jgi:threonine/homoserine/homoserine lactone efflux protein
VTVLQSLIGFGVVAALITVAPGLDSALVLRSAMVRGWRPAAWIALGISCGVLTWGAAAAVGVSALLAASQLAYDIVRLLGAAYLLYLGARMLIRAVRGGSTLAVGSAAAEQPGTFRTWLTGYTTNLLNPKIGVFYVAALPQFLVPGVSPLAMGLLLAGVHVALGTVWLGLLIVAASAAARWLRRASVARAIDAVTGVVLVGLGIRTALERA